MPDFAWNAAKARIVLEQNQVILNKVDVIRTKIENRFVQLATPTELFEMIILMRTSTKLHKELVTIVNTLERDIHK